MKAKIAIIGAGLSGISAAATLSKTANVTIFEKARGYGGRMSTRTRGNYQFDHGAQYFYATSEPFKTLVTSLAEKKILETWKPKIVSIDGQHAHNCMTLHSNRTLYVPIPKMSSMCRYLSSNLDVHLGVRVDKIIKSKKWALYQGTELLGNFDWVICAMPPRQVAELAPSCFRHIGSIAKIEMDACFALMIGRNNSINLDWDAAHVNNHNISWIALNNSKANRAKPQSIIAHSTNLWATENMEQDKVLLTNHLLTSLSSILSTNLLNSEHIDLHCWRYAKVRNRNTANAYVDSEHCLGACGDWCTTGNIEGAFDSGQAIAYEIIEGLET